MSFEDGAICRVIWITLIFIHKEYNRSNKKGGIRNGKNGSLWQYRGIAGGILFEIIMQTMGQREILSAMLGSSGWTVHVMISIVFDDTPGTGF